MKQPKPTYEELEARLDALERQQSNLKHWVRVLSSRAEDPIFPKDSRQAYLFSHNGLKRILK